MQRLRSSGTSVFASLAVPQLRKKALNSWSAVQDTYFSTKDIFERHKVVFTISTSLASVATAWAGYSIRVLHQSKVDQKLDSIEKALKNNHQMEHAEIKKIVDSGSTAASFATAGTTLIIGYGLGWRGGRWYANRKFRKEQMKLLGQIKPRRWQMLGKIKPKGWQFQFLRRRLTKPRAAESSVKTSEMMQKDAPSTHNSGRPLSLVNSYIDDRGFHICLLINSDDKHY
ncbi:hypothetical protein L1049_025074 [Liquidambar formosana]|uniref:Uncharacterized protein n=1 Tax=Liquidambar formosana TaxID=63359 RepID=A0AAP0RVH6_LIQFO